MNCCDDYGACNQGRDCPARRKTDDERVNALVKRLREEQPDDPAAEVNYTGKALACAAIVLLVFSALVVFT